MPYISGKNSYLSACDIYGASFVISLDGNAMTLSETKDNPSYKRFGASNVGRVVGIMDTTLTGAGVWNSDAPSGSSAAAILQDMMTGSWVTPLRWAPAGSVSGCPLYSLSALLNSFEVTTPVDGVVVYTFAFGNAADGGIVTGSCT